MVDRSLHGELPAEAQLLLCCLRVPLDTENRGRIAILARESLDWEALLRMAAHHEATPLLFRNLSETCREEVPAEIFQRLQHHFRATAARNLYLSGVLFRILELLETEQIPVIPYKGPSLAQSLYGAIELRQFVDLDLMVRINDVSRIRRLLVSQGYTIGYTLSHEQEAAYLKSGNEYGFSLPGQRILLEIQWAFTPRYFCIRFDPEGLWQRAVNTELLGKTVLAFSPEDMLLILCVHGYKHCWTSLKWIADLAQHLRMHPQLDWSRVLGCAGDMGCRRLLLLGLWLAADLLKAPLPAETQRLIVEDGMARLYAAHIQANLFSPNSIPRGLGSATRFHLGLRERPADRLCHCLRLALPPALGDIQVVALPGFLHFLYYLVRPFRIAWKYGVLPVSAILRGNKAKTG